MLPIGFRTARRTASVAVVAAVTAGVVGACSPAATPAPPAPPPPPPPPPAACLLDTAALAEATGLGWAPDPSTASDTRCVYDPSGAPSAGADTGADTRADPAFVTVEVAPAADPDSALDTVSELCEDGSEVPAGDAGVVCRFQSGSVFAAAVRDGRLVTVAASEVPEGTTAARLVVAFDQQVVALRP